MRQSRSTSDNSPFKPFDVTTRQLVEDNPQSWVEYVGLPLAPLTDDARARLLEIIHRMQSRIVEESPPGLRKDLWAATFLLMGLRYERAFSSQLLKGVRGMEESTTYQWLISQGKEQGLREGEVKGRAEEARNLLMRIGRARFGKPTPKVQTALESASLEHLEKMADRLLQVETWQELLAQ